MLNKAYEALRQFQSKFQQVNTIEEAQALAKSLDVEFSIMIRSYRLWEIDWDITNDELTGAFKLEITPRIAYGGKEIQLFSQLIDVRSPEFRLRYVGVESPKLSSEDIKKMFMEALQDSMKNFPDIGI